ncbi:MAG: sulfatase-like hydrolase/transferase [Burkholderiales bacterium]|nr:sulfatase-like hydrolase/transferase [Burkholderiales bacterium]
MLVLKKYFLTANALLVFLLVFAASHLQGHLAFLMQFKNADRIIRLIGKIDQVSFILVSGIALAIAAIYFIIYRQERFNRLFLVLLTIFALTIFFKGKFENLGADSVAEIFSSNSQEAADYAISHLFRVNLTIKESLVLLAPFVLIPVYLGMTKGLQSAIKVRDIRLAFFVVAGIYAMAVLSFCGKLLNSYQSIDSYQAPLRQSTLAAMPFFSKVREAPNVVVYIGESTVRDGFGPYRTGSSQMNPLHGLEPNLIAFTNVITAFSHTFPSLYRTFTVANDPYADQFLLIRNLRRANVLSVLSSNDIEAHWLSNQNRGCQLDWTSQLFGEQAPHLEFLNLANKAECPNRRKYDAELLHAFERHANSLDRPRQTLFLHSYAGHDSYCTNIPQTEREAINPLTARFSKKALFGDAHIPDMKLHRKAINCYESAISYVEKNIRTVIDNIAEQSRPTILLYFSDHGEDPYAGTGHDSRNNSFRHLEIPFLVYFNKAAMERFPELYQAAHDNRHKRYSLEWFSDSLLDLEGITYAKRPLMSIFRKDLAAPPRYALRKSDLSGNNLILAIDEEDASAQFGLLNHGHDFYQKRRLVNKLPDAEANKLCAAGVDSMLKFLEASQIFRCVEINVTMDEKSGRLLAYRPPKKNNELELGSLVGSGIGKVNRLYLSIQSLNRDNFDFLLMRLNNIFPRSQRSNVMINLHHYEDMESAHIHKIVEAGYKVFYELSDYRSQRCVRLKESVTCRRFIEETLKRLSVFRFHGIAFAREAYVFADMLPLSGQLEISVRDLSVRKTEDLSAMALSRSSIYLVPYRSDFDY